MMVEPIEVVDRANLYLKSLVEECIPTVEKELVEARRRFEEERKWYGSDADRGYLEVMQQEYSKLMAIKRILEFILGVSIEPNPREK